jgi:hypothetical protein
MENLPEARSTDNTTTVDFAMDALVAALGRALSTRRGAEASFEGFEQSALKLCNEAVRRTLQGKLQEAADAMGEELLINGALFHRHQPGKVTYHSLCGPLPVTRFTYREVGVRNGPTCVPLELSAGMLEHATPALAAAVGRGHADRTSRALEEDLRAAQRAPPSRSTIERMAVELGTQVKAAVAKIEPALRRCERVPKGANAIVLGLDRTTVPMLERISEEKVAVHYRMAYVATVTVVDGEANPLQTRRYAAPAHEGPGQILSRLEADLRQTRRQRPALQVAVVQDGAPELWNLIRDLLRRAKVPRWIERIDRYHAEQYLAGALDVLGVRGEKRTALWERWKELLNSRNGAIRRINREIDEMGRGRSRKVYSALSRHRMYLLCHEHLLRYATLRKLGIPQGSGVTEGACKSLVTMRTKRSGQRWSKRGIESVLALRSIVHSDRWPRYWRSFTKSRRFSIEMIRR